MSSVSIHAEVPVCDEFYSAGGMMFYSRFNLLSGNPLPGNPQAPWN